LSGDLEDYYQGAKLSQTKRNALNKELMIKDTFQELLTNRYQARLATLTEANAFKCRRMKGKKLMDLRKDNPEDIRKWKVRHYEYYITSCKKYCIGATKPGKEAATDYKMKPFPHTGSKKSITNPHDMLPVIMDGNDNIASKVTFCIPEILDANIDAMKKCAIKHDANYEKKISGSGKNGRILKKDIKNYLRKEWDDTRLANLPQKVKKYTPFTLEQIHIIFEEIILKPEGKLCLEILGCLVTRMAFMLDHKTTINGEWRLTIPSKSLTYLNQHLPFLEFQEGAIQRKFTPEAFLYFLDVLAINEEIKVDRKGNSKLKREGKIAPNGRVNTLLTYSYCIAATLQRKSNAKIIFGIQRGDAGMYPLIRSNTKLEAEAFLAFPLLSPDLNALLPKDTIKELGWLSH